MIFQTAIIDPPWPYREVRAGKSQGYVCDQYKLMPIDELKTLPVGDVVSGYLFCWTTGPFVWESVELMKAWGFEYKSQLVWHKNTGLGVGYWFRGDHELVMVGRKPNVPSVRCPKQRSIFASPRLKHSQKPDTIHEIIEQNFPGPYLEIFGRRSRPNWTVLGNEAPDDGKDIRESLKLVRKTHSPVPADFLQDL
jgi:N6-adenosine-specific RNA methylase IME4